MFIVQLICQMLAFLSCLNSYNVFDSFSDEKPFSSISFPQKLILQLRSKQAILCDITGIYQAYLSIF